MAEAPREYDKPATVGNAGSAAWLHMGVRPGLMDNSDKPALANCTSVGLAPGKTFFDFGFLAPRILAAIARVAKQSEKLPQSANAKHAVRVAMRDDGLSGLHQQSSRIPASFGNSGIERGTKP